MDIIFWQLVGALIGISALITVGCIAAFIVLMLMRCGLDNTKK